MKRMFLFLLAVTIVISLAITSHATEINTKVFDDASVLTDLEEQLLQEKAVEVESLGYDLVIVTIRELGELSAAKYALNFFELHKRGLGSDGSGVLLLWSAKNGDWAVYTNGKAKEALPTEKLNAITLEASTYLTQNRYYEAFDAFISSVAKSLSDYSDDGQSILDIIRMAAFSIIISLIVTSMIMLYLQSKKTTPTRKTADSSFAVESGSFKITSRTNTYLYEVKRKYQQPPREKRDIHGA